jgi:hypothetical protein
MPIATFKQVAHANEIDGLGPQLLCSRQNTLTRLHDPLNGSSCAITISLSDLPV